MHTLTHRGTASLLLILTAILNPEGIAGGIRQQAAAAKHKRETKSTSVPVTVPAT